MNAATPSVPRASVEPLVRGAHRALVAARAAECVLVGATALFVALWAALASGADSGRAPAWEAASATALLAALAWWRAHRASAAGVARRLDRAFGCDGALVTAFEVEREGHPTRVGRLLARRVAGSIAPRRARRAVLPRSAVLVALPFLAAALVAQARAASRARAEEAASIGGATARLRAELGALGDELAAPAPAGAPRLSAEEVRELYDLARRAAELDGARRRNELEPELARQRLADLQADLVRLEARLPVESGIARRLEEAESTVDSALQSSAPTGIESSSEASMGLVEGRSGASEGGPDGSGSAGALAPAPANGTMARPDRAPPATGRTEAGTVAGRWWPAEESELVSRWIELRRAR